MVSSSHHDDHFVVTCLKGECDGTHEEHMLKVFHTIEAAKCWCALHLTFALPPGEWDEVLISKLGRGTGVTEYWMQFIGARQLDAIRWVHFGYDPKDKRGVGEKQMKRLN